MRFSETNSFVFQTSTKGPTWSYMYDLENSKALVMIEAVSAVSNSMPKNEHLGCLTGFFPYAIGTPRSMHRNRKVFKFLGGLNENHGNKKENHLDRVEWTNLCTNLCQPMRKVSKSVPNYKTNPKTKWQHLVIIISIDKEKPNRSKSEILMDTIQKADLMSDFAKYAPLRNMESMAAAKKVKLVTEPFSQSIKVL